MPRGKEAKRKKKQKRKTEREAIKAIQKGLQPPTGSAGTAAAPAGSTATTPTTSTDTATSSSANTSVSSDHDATLPAGANPLLDSPVNLPLSPPPLFERPSISDEEYSLPEDQNVGGSTDAKRTTSLPPHGQRAILVPRPPSAKLNSPPKRKDFERWNWPSTRMDGSPSRGRVSSTQGKEREKIRQRSPLFTHDDDGDKQIFEKLERKEKKKAVDAEVSTGKRINFLQPHELGTTGWLTDLTITVGRIPNPNATMFHVHQCLLTLNSTYFSALLLESDVTKIPRIKNEVHPYLDRNRIFLTEHEPHVFQEMLEWIYSNNFSTSKNIYSCVKLLIEAEHFGVISLMEACLACIVEELEGRKAEYKMTALVTVEDKILLEAMVLLLQHNTVLSDFDLKMVLSLLAASGFLQRVEADKRVQTVLQGDARVVLEIMVAKLRLLVGIGRMFAETVGGPPGVMSVGDLQRRVGVRGSTIGMKMATDDKATGESKMPPFKWGETPEVKKPLPLLNGGAMKKGKTKAMEDGTERPPTPPPKSPLRKFFNSLPSWNLWNEKANEKGDEETDDEKGNCPGAFPESV